MKIKPLSKEQITISIDRLTRFKHPETKYLRVFCDIILGNLIEPKFKKSELEKLDYKTLKNYAQEIINYSLKINGLNESFNPKINEAIKSYEIKTYNCNNKVVELLDNEINYNACKSLISEISPLNMIWLKELPSEGIINLRQKMGFKFPIEKLILVEGITEEILLPEFAKLCGYDFDKNGVYVLSAGGKNQIVKLFYKLSESLKLPIYILMDTDAQKNYDEIKPKLRKNDKVHILKCGEFEDTLPIKLVERTLKEEFKNISITEPLHRESKMVKVLEEVFKHRGMHEFKKAEFAHMIKENLKNQEDISSEIKELINEIKNYC